MDKNDTFLALTKTALILTVFGCVVLFGLDKISWAKGFALGSLFSVLNFALLRYGIRQRLGQSGKVAKVKGFAFILVRYAVLALPLLVAFKKREAFNLPATIAGLFCIQSSILFYYFIWLRFSRSKN